MKKELTAERLRELLDYDAEAGVFTWRVRSCNRYPELGRVAGTPDGKGYLMVGIDQVRYKLHRLAFLHMTGVLPPEIVDHRNGCVTDNRWENLRPCSLSENGQNRKTNSNNRLGLLGVSPNKLGFAARIALHGKRIYLGTYRTPEQAHQAYLAAKAVHHTFQPVPREVAA